LKSVEKVFNYKSVETVEGCDKNFFFSVNFGNSVGEALSLSWISVRSVLPALELKVPEET
jgi:hypothetical protein